MGRAMRNHVRETIFTGPACRWWLVLFLACSFSGEMSSAMAEGVRKDEGLAPTYAKRIRPLLQKYCFECHGEKTAKNNLRLDTLDPDFRTAQATATWKEVLGRVANQADDAMPPKEKLQPSAEEIKALRDAGVNVAAGADNLQDPFNPVGRGDALETAGLMVMASHLLPDEALHSISAAPRRMMGLPPADPAAGDFVALRASTVREAIAFGPPDRIVVRRGRLVAGQLPADALRDTP